MKLIHEDAKKGLAKVKIEGPTDLWYLFRIIKAGDRLAMTTTRAVKFGNVEERKPVFIRLEVERTEFREHPTQLRATGKILEGRPEEFVQVGRYHSFDIKEGDVLAIEKEWQRYEKELLREAIEESRKALASILLCDEKKVVIVRVEPFGYREVGEITLPSSKRLEEKERQTLKAKAYDKLLGEKLGQIVIVAGPGFEKESLAEFLKSNGYKVKLADVGYAEMPAVKELVDKSIVEAAIGEARLEREAKLVNEALKHIYKNDGFAVYGKADVEKAVESGAVKSLLVLDKLLLDDKTRELLKKAEAKGAKINVISHENEWGKLLEGFTGLVAKLHYSLK